MRWKLALAAPLLVLTLGGAAKPLALSVETQALGQGTTGTVTGVLVQVAPEDRERAGERVRVVTSLYQGDRLVDRQASVVALEPDGTVLLYRELEPGKYELRVVLAALEGEHEGLWVGEVEVHATDRPFAAPEGAPVDAVALELTPPAEGVVQFEVPSEAGGIGATMLEVSAPEETASVTFLHDGREVSRRNRPPWTVSIPLGEVVQRTVVTAVARDAKGRYLGEDAVVLNPPTGQLALELLLAPLDTVRAGKRTVTVAVSGGGPLTAVALQLDDRTVARWAQCPCVVELPVEELEKASVLSADAVDAKGTRGDAVLPLAQGAGTFSGSITVELVELSAVVLDANGVPVPDLTRDDFAVFEDDQAVALEGFGTTADTQLSLALGVDISGSMLEEISDVRSAVSGFATDLIRPDDEVALLLFSWDTSVEVPWTTNAEAVRTRLDRVEPGGGTSLRDAVVRSLEQFRGRRGRQALVLLTDGEDTTSRTAWDTAERFVRTMRIPIFPVGLGVGRLSFGGRGVLDNLAQETGGAAFYPKKPAELAAVYGQIGQLLRSQYLLWYRSSSTKPASELRRVRVEVKRPGVKVRTISGYYPGR